MEKSLVAQTTTSRLFIHVRSTNRHVCMYIHSTYIQMHSYPHPYEYGVELTRAGTSYSYICTEYSQVSQKCTQARCANACVFYFCLPRPPPPPRDLHLRVQARCLCLACVVRRSSLVHFLFSNYESIQGKASFPPRPTPPRPPFLSFLGHANHILGCEDEAYTYGETRVPST